MNSEPQGASCLCLPLITFICVLPSMTFYVGSEYLNSDPTLGQPAVQEFKLSISTAAD